MVPISKELIKILYKIFFSITICPLFLAERKANKVTRDAIGNPIAPMLTPQASPINSDFPMNSIVVGKEPIIWLAIIAEKKELSIVDILKSIEDLSNKNMVSIDRTPAGISHSLSFIICVGLPAINASTRTIIKPIHQDRIYHSTSVHIAIDIAPNIKSNLMILCGLVISSGLMFGDIAVMKTVTSAITHQGINIALKNVHIES